MSATKLRAAFDVEILDLLGHGPTLSLHGSAINHSAATSTPSPCEKRRDGLQKRRFRTLGAQRIWRTRQGDIPMLTSDAQFFLNRANEMRMAARHDQNGRRPAPRTTDVNAFLDQMGLGGRVRRI